LSVEYRLDGASNYGSWKPRVLLYLEENKVKYFSLTTMPVPNDATQLVAWKKNDVKAWKILMEYMKNHLVSHLAKLETAKEMFDSMKKLFERHLSIFKCHVYVHVLWERGTKLDPSGRKGVFVGYSESIKAYQIYIPGQRKIELSRCITFEEYIAYRRYKHAKSDSDEQEAP
jgi:hypothetical protein